MKIRLNEIPQEGREFVFDQKSGEINKDIEDLIGKSDFHVDLYIKPIGNAYEMRGSIKTQIPEVCSYCGYDFQLPIKRQIHEILFEEQEAERKAHNVHGNQSVDFLANGPSMTPIKGDVFEPGEFVHETIALTEPFYPMCGAKGECLRKDEVSEIRRKLELEWLAAEEKKAGHPAFSVLESLELNKKN